jgi:hypothetical protein
MKCVSLISSTVFIQKFSQPQKNPASYFHKFITFSCPILTKLYSLGKIRQNLQCKVSSCYIWIQGQTDKQA